ncbi:MAG: nucleotidyltransferase domain-containing protein [Candidatus Bathyarchaeota archaeon]
MAIVRLRDRDSIITEEGLIFRVFGYSHPSNAYFCDAEYARSDIFKSRNPKAFRNRKNKTFYKFYEDEGWRYVQKYFPQHMISHEMVGKKVVGVTVQNIHKVRNPNKILQKLKRTESKDTLVRALQHVLRIVIQHSNLSMKDFGVFGSILHGFHHSKFSDIDLTIYGSKNLDKLLETLKELYKEEYSFFRNEFDTNYAIQGKLWKFMNYGPDEYLQHQKRKMIYALFNDKKSGRVIKVEFEPIKSSEEVRSQYNRKTKVQNKGWTKMYAKIVEDQDSPFIPSIYGIEPLNVLEGQKGASEVKRVISYIEEFRMQSCLNEIVYVEGNLEKVVNPKGDFHQIALTYCPRYYEQVLKSV